MAPRGAGGDRPELDLCRLVDLIDLAYQAIELPGRLHSLLAEVAAATGVESILLVGTAGGERQLLADAHVALRRDEVRDLAPRSERGTRTVPLGGGLELVLDRAELPPAGRLLLQRLIPHLARALRLAERFAAVERAGLHVAAIERLALAVTLLDERGRILLLNRAARRMVSTGGPLGIEDGRLVPRHPLSRVLFESLVERVASPASSGRRRGGGRLRLEDGDGEPVDLVVTAFDGHVDGAAASCAVFLSEVGSPASLEARLSEIHGLGEDETRAFLHLVEGCPSASADMNEGIARGVKALYGKLGSTRQRDLVGLLLRPPGAVYLAGGGEG